LTPHGFKAIGAFRSGLDVIPAHAFCTGLRCFRNRYADFEDFMANTPQAKKRIRRNDRRSEVNGARVSRIRTMVKKVENAAAAGDKQGASEALKLVQPEIAKGVSKGVIHKNTASRKYSRLTKRVAALA